MPPTYIYGINKFSVVNTDTIWGVGGTIMYPNNQVRGLIYRTTNGGNNWGYQIPDSSIHIPVYHHIKFVNGLNGWSYYSPGTGVHTVTGGDSLTIYGLINQIKTYVPVAFNLYQNYPNPFNPATTIRYQVSKKSNIQIKVFDILGNEVMLLVRELQHPGTYEIRFSGISLSSGIYFYSLFANGKLIDTKKMLIIK